MSLCTVTGLEEGELCRRLDALGNDAKREILAHRNDGADDGRFAKIAGDLVDKALVNFQDINGKLAEIKLE